MARRFVPEQAAAIDAIKYLRIRAGSQHRFIPVWVVLVEGRVLVRSWNNKPDGWFAAFLQEPTGAIEVDGRPWPIRAVRVTDAAVRRAANAAFAAKYTTRPNRAYVVGFAEPGRMKNTLELVPS